MSTIANLKLFSDFAQGTMTEILPEQIDLFNGATANGLVLRTQERPGDFFDATYWAQITGGLVKRRNARNSGALTAKTLQQLQETSVKVDAGTHPIYFQPQALRRILKNPKEAGVTYGTQLAQERLADMVNVAIGSFVAAHKVLASNYHDAKAKATALQVLNTAAAKLGDSAGDLALWLMHSTPAHDLYGQALNNENRLFEYGNVKVVNDGFGRPIVMSDAESLINVEGVSAGVNSYNICGLIPGAVLVEDNGDFFQNEEVSNGKENIEATIQSEWTYNVGLNGFAWDKTNGGASPTTAALTTSANWDKVATSHKNLGGVVLETRALDDVA